MTTMLAPSTEAGFELDVERGPAGCARVAARGELDQFTCPVLCQTVGQLIASGRTRITLDLTALTFLDSAGHRAIGALADLAEGLGGEVRLDGWSRSVPRFLDLTDSVLATAPTDGPTTRPYRKATSAEGDRLPRE